MKQRIALVAFLFITACAFAADAGPEPSPWWQRVEETQSLALKWIGSLTVVLGALATLVAFVIGKVNELKARVEKQSDRSDIQQQQIHEIALNAPPAQQPPTNTTVIENNPQK